MEVLGKMFKFLILINYLNLFIINKILCSEVTRPRGVSLSRASLYSPGNDFTCFDNSKTIPFSQVNDDYCDCLDASDEPGTSACPHGIFYCTNAGHKPINIASSRVNDGICDCCDGSDEYKTQIKCINNCYELAKTAREEALQKEALLKAGKQLREELSQKGIQEKQHKKEKLTELERNKEEAERVKAEKEILKKEAEEVENHALEYYRNLENEKNKEKLELEATKHRSEASTAFNRYDLNQDGKINFNELQQFQTFDKDKNGEVSEEEAKYFLNDNEEIDIEQFVSDSWNRIKPYLMIEAGDFKETQTEQNEENIEEEQNEEEEETEEEPEPPKPEEETQHIQYDEETQQLVDTANAARTEFTNAESAVKDIDNEIKEIKDYLDKDFGQYEEYAPLLGECFNYEDHEYIYKLCPFDKTIQQPKSGSMETRLGTWSKWSGPDDNKYESMLYERGQACWNGPQRSTFVKISCGSENKLISVSEPNKCEYVFEFLTPASCYDYSNDNKDVHDEL